MKPNVIIGMLVFLTLALVVPINHTMAAKSMSVIAMSNGFPSGPHYNLNIHGKSASFSCDPTMGGNSVFISEYGDSTISYVTNNKSLVSELLALDKCAQEFDGDPANVQLPYEPEGYYVFAVIKGKPNNGTTAEESSIILSPNAVTAACNDTHPANPDFPNYTECPTDTLLALGLIVGPNVYGATDIGFMRFQNQETSKGKSRATDITDLFKYSGWVYSVTLDTYPVGAPDGVIDVNDVPLSYDLIENGGNGDGFIDLFEFENWRADQVLLGLATEYTGVWIFNIADLVLTDQPITNDGTKLLQVRFYPVATTVYIPPAE